MVLGRKNALTKHLYKAMLDETQGKASIYYMNKEKATRLLAGAGLQLPRSYNAYGYVSNIQQEGPLVNHKYLLRTYWTGFSFCISFCMGLQNAIIS